MLSWCCHSLLEIFTDAAQEIRCSINPDNLDSYLRPVNPRLASPRDIFICTQWFYLKLIFHGNINNQAFVYHSLVLTQFSFVRQFIRKRRQSKKCLQSFISVFPCPTYSFLCRHYSDWENSLDLNWQAWVQIPNQVQTQLIRFGSITSHTVWEHEKASGT